MPALRLCDIGPDEYLCIVCGGCRRVAHLPPPYPSRFLRAAPETPITDIIPRLHCSNCDARDGFRVTIERDRRDRSTLAGREPPIAIIAEPGGSAG